jgi:hypothetical protein
LAAQRTAPSEWACPGTCFRNAVKHERERALETTWNAEVARNKREIYLNKNID